MQNKIDTWTMVSDSLKKKVPVMLLYVVHSTGSSPGRAGFFMAVNAAGVLQGSIGGGIMEHKLVELAKSRLATKSSECSLHKQVHNKSSANNQSGMICSGEQTIVMYPLQKNDQYALLEIIECLEQNRTGCIQLTLGGLDFFYASQIEEEGLVLQNDQWQYREKIGYTNRLYIIGGGHCALALSKLMSDLNFFICVIDDRQNLNTYDANGFVQQKCIVESYSGINGIVSEGDRVYVIIMTLGYRTDDLAFRALVGMKFGYLGILGSSNKIKKMMEEYQVEGINDQWLSSISAPAGLPINSQTPEEIAVSIAAQIIQVRNSGKRDH